MPPCPAQLSIAASRRQVPDRAAPGSDTLSRAPVQAPVPRKKATAAHPPRTLKCWMGSGRFFPRSWCLRRHAGQSIRAWCSSIGCLAAAGSNRKLRWTGCQTVGRRICNRGRLQGIDCLFFFHSLNQFDLVQRLGLFLFVGRNSFRAGPIVHHAAKFGEDIGLHFGNDSHPIYSRCIRCLS